MKVHSFAYGSKVFFFPVLGVMGRTWYLLLIEIVFVFFKGKAFCHDFVVPNSTALSCTFACMCMYLFDVNLANIKMHLTGSSGSNMHVENVLDLH